MEEGGFEPWVVLKIPGGANQLGKFFICNFGFRQYFLTLLSNKGKERKEIEWNLDSQNKEIIKKKCLTF